MMRPANSLPAVYLCVAPVDFRLQINGLAACVQEALLLDLCPSNCSPSPIGGARE